MYEDEVADAVKHAFQSPNVSDSNGETANVVDVIDGLAIAVRHLGQAITPTASPGKDSHGNHVESLTEAVMGVEMSLHEIAKAIDGLADAVREHASSTCRDG